jgi:hypothetical protein
MPFWEHLIVWVDSDVGDAPSPYVLEILTGPPWPYPGDPYEAETKLIWENRLLWEPFLARLLAEGWQPVPTDLVDEYTFKRTVDVPTCEGIMLPELHNTTVLNVRFDLATMCGGAFWTPTAINGIPVWTPASNDGVSIRFGGGWPNDAQFYNQLGASGWELHSVRTMTERGLYYSSAPREARFERHN